MTNNTHTHMTDLLADLREESSKFNRLAVQYAQHGDMEMAEYCADLAQAANEEANETLASFR